MGGLARWHISGASRRQRQTKFKARAIVVPGLWGSVWPRGTRIEGLDEAGKVEGVEIFHAGTVSKDGNILANGGRELNVCASGKTVAEAQARAYAAVDRIEWPDGFCRRDIGWQAVERERN